MTVRPIPRHLRNATHWPIEMPEVKCGLCGERLIGPCHVTMDATTGAPFPSCVVIWKGEAE